MNAREILNKYFEDYGRFGIEQVAIEFFDEIRERNDDAEDYYRWLYERNTPFSLGDIWESAIIVKKGVDFKTNLSKYEIAV